MCLAVATDLKLELEKSSISSHDSTMNRPADSLQCRTDKKLLYS